MLRAAAAALAAAFTLAAPGCGGGDPKTPSGPPGELLAEAFANPVSSGESVADAEVALEGVPLLSEPLVAHLSGPFEGAADGGLPSFDLEMDGEAAGFGVDADLISTGDDAFVVFFGETYRVGAERVAAAEARLAAGGGADGLGLDPASWFEDPRYAGSEEVEGTDAERIEATLDAAAASADLANAASALGLPIEVPAAGGGSAEAWVAYDDHTIRRLRVEGLRFTVPPAQRELAGGATGGTATFGLAVSDVGSEVEIEPPSGGGQPIEQLIGRIRDLAGFAL